MQTSTAPRNRLPFAIILTCALIAVGWQLLHPGYYCIWKNDVAYTHKYVLQFTESFKQGILYPRWMAECFGGYGSPVFVYYSPSLYYLAGMAGLAGVGPDFSTSFFQLLSLFVGGVSLYYLLDKPFGQRAALIGAAVYCLNPTRFLFLYYINTYAGRFAEALMPLTLFFTWRLMDGPFKRRNLAWMALSYSALILSHLATAYIFTPLLIAFAFLYTGKPPKEVLPRLALGLLAGMCAAGFFFLPVLMERGYVNLTRLNIYLTRPSFVFDLTGTAGPSVTGRLPQILMNSIIAETVFTGIAVYLAVRKTALVFSRKIIFMLTAVCVCLFMMSSLSMPLWKELPGLSSVAFPFRFITIFMIFVPAIFGIAADRLIQARPGLIMIVSAALLALALGGYDLILVAIAPVSVPQEAEINKDMDMAEYLPVASTAGSTSANDRKLTGDDIHAEIKEWGYISREIDVDSPGGGRLRLKTFFFPGWRGYVDGREYRLYPEAGTGAMLIDVPPGKHTVTLGFGDTLPRKAGKIISLLTLLLLFLPYRLTPRPVQAP